MSFSLEEIPDPLPQTLKTDVLQLEDTPEYVLEGKIPGISVVNTTNVADFVKTLSTPILVQAIVVDNLVPRFAESKRTDFFGYEMIMHAHYEKFDVPKYLYTSEPDEISTHIRNQLAKFNARLVSKRENNPLDFGIPNHPTEHIQGPELITHLLQTLKDQ